MVMDVGSPQVGSNQTTTKTKGKVGYRVSLHSFLESPMQSAVKLQMKIAKQEGNNPAEIMAKEKAFNMQPLSSNKRTKVRSKMAQGKYERWYIYHHSTFLRVSSSFPHVSPLNQPQNAQSLPPPLSTLSGTLYLSSCAMSH